MASAHALKLLVDALHAIQVTRFAELGSTAIVLYDHLITLDDEIELIWKSQWSVGKVLFLLNRYNTLAGVIVDNYGLFAPTLSRSFCVNFFHWQGWAGIFAYMIAEIILQMRLYALYLLNKKILVLMVTSFILANGAAATILAIVLNKISVAPTTLPGRSGVTCVPSNIPSYFYLYWVPTIAFESLLCVLALFQGFRTFKRGGDLFQSGRRLVGILIRDSVFYFVVMFSAYLTNLLVWVAASQNFLEVPIGFAVALSCILTNRLILNVRHENEEIAASKAAQSPISPTRPSLPFTFPSYTDKTDMLSPCSPTYSHTPLRDSRRLSAAPQDVRSSRSYMYGNSILTDIEMNELRTMRDETVSSSGVVWAI